MITIPLGFTPVPVNLGTLGVFLTGGILGKKYGTVSMSVYVLLGAIGIPVFAGFRGGLGVLAGPTGGYIIGYIVAVFLIGIILELAERGAVSRATEATARAVDISAAGTSSRAADVSAAATNSRATEAASRASYITTAAAMVVGLLACYLLGTIWFIISTGTGLWASLVACVFPFLPGDALKIAAATILVRRLRRII